MARTVPSARPSNGSAATGEPEPRPSDHLSAVITAGGGVMTVAHRSEAVRQARRRLAEDLETRGLPPRTVDETEVSVSELVGNAVRHARSLPHGAVEVAWHVQGETVDLDVTDGGTDLPARVGPRPPQRWGTSGRGLRIVQSLAHEWGVTDHDDGSRTVWAALGGPSRRRR